MADESLLAASIARQLHISESPNQALIETLASRLARARSLLVLDGCEHLIEAVAKLADYLLEHTSELRILATSRELLSIRDEHLVHVGPLPIPSAGVRSVQEIESSDAVALFVDRARLVVPGSSSIPRTLRWSPRSADGWTGSRSPSSSPPPDSRSCPSPS